MNYAVAVRDKDGQIVGYRNCWFAEEATHVWVGIDSGGFVPIPRDETTIKKPESHDDHSN